MLGQDLSLTFWDADYSVFSQQDLQMSDNDRIQAVCKAKAGLVDSNANLWTFVGEWTPANTDCAASLNGKSSIIHLNAF